MPSLGSISVASVLTAVVLTLAGCYSGAPAPGTTDPPLMTASPDASPVIADCPNFVEVVVTGPVPGDDGTEDGPVAREQQRISGDVDLAAQYGAGHPDEFASMRYENGPRVRLVIGFTAHIEEHCAALRAILEYPEEFEIIRQPATEAQLMTIMDDLSARYRERMRSIGMGAGVLDLTLRADGEAVAAEVVADYGELVRITLGMLPYPDRFASGSQCGPLVGPIAAGLPLVAATTLDGDTVRTGMDFRGTVSVLNVGAEPIDFQSGPTQTAVVFRPGAEAPSGLFTGGLDAIGFGKRLAPGESVDLEVVGGTASCDPDLGYALPPGDYEVRVPVIQLTMHDNAPTELSYVLSEPVPLTITP
jgi:hypothetical protein